MASKDIDLVIKAKNRASGAIDEISKSLRELTSDQGDLTKGAGRTSNALSGLSSDVQKLQREADRLKSLGTIAAEMDKASAAVTRMQTNVQGSAGEMARLARASDEAAQAASRLKAQLDAEERSLEATKSDLKARQEELRKVNDLVRQATKDQQALNAARSKRVGGNMATAGVGTESGAPATSARASTSAFVAAGLDSARAQQARVTDEIKQYETAINQSAAALKELRPQVSAASALQRTLADESDKASAALTRERNSLDSARIELSKIEGVAGQASAALGGVAVGQQEVAAAAKRANEQLAATRRILETTAKFSAGNGTFADPKSAAALRQQTDAVQQARAEWKLLEAEIQSTATQMRANGSATAEQTTRMAQLTGAARAAKAEFQQQSIALARLGGATRSSFAEFSQAVGLSRTSADRFVLSARAAADAATKTAASSQRSAAAIHSAGNAAATAAAQTRLFSGALSGLQSSTQRGLSLMQSLRAEVLALTAGYVGLQAGISNIGSAINAYQTLEAAQSRLGVVFNQDTGRVAQEIAFLREQADRLGISFGTLANEYGKFAVAAQSSNFTTEETRKVFLSVAEAGRAAKLSNDQLQGTFLALTQMMSKGTISAEELRGQLGERLSGAYQIFADAIGVSTAELGKMMEQGEVLANRSNLLKFADEMTERFGPQLAAALDTASTDIGRFQNNIEQMHLTIANGLIPGLREALQSFNSFSKSAEGEALFSSIGETVGKLLVLLAEVPKHFDLISIGVQALIGLGLAQVLAGIARQVLVTTKAAASFTRELTLIGPRAQTATAAQGVLNAGMAQVISTLGTYRQSLLATTSSTGAARIATVSLAGAVGILRVGLIAATGIASAFMAALGGPIGLAATAVTAVAFAIGQWVTSVDTASTALAEHERQVQALKTAYSETGDEVEGWADKIKGVTVAQALANTEALRKGYEDATRSIADYARQAIAWYSDIIAAVPNDPRSFQAVKLDDLASQFRDGTIDINAFEQALNRIALNPADEQIKNLALRMLDMLNKSDETRKSLAELSDELAQSEAKLRLMNGTATEADKVLLGLKESTDKATGAFDRSSAIGTYTAAIDTLKSKIPGLTDELKHLKDMTELNTTAWGGMVAAFQSGNYGKIGEIISLWAQAAAAAGNAQNVKAFGSADASSAASLIKQFEGFSPEPYYDVNAYRAGYGSDTVTLADGSVKKVVQGITVTLDDAARDLARRIGEFQDTIKGEIGSNRFAAFSREQQAVITSIAYNYGNLRSTGELDAFKSGTVEEIAAAIERLATHNAGVNADRRNQEASIFRGAGTPYALEQQQVTRSVDTQERLATLDAQIKQQDLINAGKEREAEIEKAIIAARIGNPAVTQEELDAIALKTGQLFDQKAANDAILTQQEQARELLSQITGLDQQRKVLLDEIKTAQDNGETERVGLLQSQLTGINGQLDQLIPKAMAFARTMGDERMVATLMKVQQNVAKAGQQFSLLGLSMKQWQGLGTSFADGLVGAIDSFAQSVANGTASVANLAATFVQFAADFLRQISQMILKQMMLNMLQAVFPGMGFGTAHTGGLVGGAGTGSGNMTRYVPPAFFTNAMRYHTGGIGGLKPDEVPAILQKNEEVLTEADPRHRFNYDASNNEEKKERSIKQVLVLNPSDLANAMSSKPGEEVIITTLKNNVATLRQLLR